MMRFLFVFFFFVTSCVEPIKTLPNAIGSLSEVIFVVDDVLWEQSIQDLVHETFAVSIEGIGQNEPTFRIVQVNHQEFKSILKTHKNIVIITEGVKQSSQQNKWANSQLVMQLNAVKNRTLLIHDFIKIKDIFVQNEIKEIKSKLIKSSNKELEQVLNNKFNIEAIIPNEYTIVQEELELFWVTYNPVKKEEIKNLLFFSFIPKKINFQEELLAKVDSIFAQYLKGEKENSYVAIEQLYSPVIIDNTIRGLWRLENGFMGGPFLVKYYFKGDKVVVAVGVIFAPNKSKRTFIKTLEAIL